jgi:hypothetical protein
MTLLRLREDLPSLVAPVLIGAFDGWIDAGGAASRAAATLAEGGEVMATAEHDTLFDYRSRRPVLDVIDGTLTSLAWPEITVRRRHQGERDLLILQGPEPDFHWRELGDSTVEMARRLGVVEWVSLGAIPAAVPHTRPVPVFGTASSEGLLPDDVAQGPEGLLRVPAAALSVLEMSIAGGGIPTVGFYAQVPHYVGGPYAAGAIGLLEQLGRHLGVDLPVGDLPDDAITQRGRLDAAVGEDEDARRYLERLEDVAGQEEGIPSGDELASEIERFLRGESGGQPGQGGEPPRPG